MLQFEAPFVLRIIRHWHWDLNLLEVCRCQRNIFLCQNGNAFLHFLTGPSEIFRCKDGLFAFRVRSLLSSSYQGSHHHQCHRSTSSLLVELPSPLDESTEKSSHLRTSTTVTIVLHDRVDPINIDKYSGCPIPKFFVLIDGIDDHKSVATKGKGMSFSDGTCSRSDADCFGRRSDLTGFVCVATFVTSGSNNNDGIANAGLLHPLEDVGLLGRVARCQGIYALDSLLIVGLGELHLRSKSINSNSTSFTFSGTDKECILPFAQRSEGIDHSLAGEHR
mmetsp:Transcript_31795/g.93348  ORF Transcript_31795/g.93348 Transcript_31795/m.93348 type:complete len:277 (-) Transcript_31795:1023-1853(-)